MKNIDFKSLAIGALLTTTIFLGVAATSKDDAGKWDGSQIWETATIGILGAPKKNGKVTYLFKLDTENEFVDSQKLKSWPEGWEPVTRVASKQNVWFVRRRVDHFQ